MSYDSVRVQHSICGDFRVSTIVYDSYFETAILFTDEDEETTNLPQQLKDYTKNYMLANSLDTTYPSSDATAGVCSFSFKDAAAVHADLRAFVANFSLTHKRVVRYVSV